MLRSNAGLELAIGLYPGELAERDRGAGFMRRLDDIHPSMGDRPYARMRSAGGEIAYARELGDRTRQWAMANPGDVAALMLLHVRQSVVPQRWQFGAFGAEAGVGIRAGCAQIAGILGLAGLLLALAGRRPGWWVPAVLLAVLVLLGAPFQPVKRYTYLLYPTLVFAAASLIDRARRVRPDLDPALSGPADTA